MIAVLCVGLIYSAVLSATNINKQTRALDDKYNSELNEVEGLSEDMKQLIPQNVVISFYVEDIEMEEPVEKPVIMYGDDESVFLSYEYEGDTP